MTTWRTVAFDEGENEHRWTVIAVDEGYQCSIDVRSEGEDESRAAPLVMIFATLPELERFLGTDYDLFLQTHARRLAEMIRHG
jgi:hypothetical protein